MAIKVLSGKVFLIITGASRGIGRQIAISFGEILEEGSHVLLLATNLNGLKETAKNLPSKLTVDTVGADLSVTNQSDLEKIILESLKSNKPSKFDRVVVVHNVGTIGDIEQRTNDMLDLDTWRKYYDLNVFIPAILNGVIMKIFNEETNTEKVVINITSLFGIQGGKAAAYYSTGKAAREMFFKIFAMENPHVNVLNYAPGPVETDMFHTVCNTIVDQQSKKEFQELLRTKTVLTATQTVNRLLEILKDQKYKNGAHIDYYDKL